MQKKRQPAKETRPELAFDPFEAALRQMFDNVAAEKIPDDFADLVARLENPRSATPKPATEIG